MFAYNIVENPMKGSLRVCVKTCVEINKLSYPFSIYLYRNNPSQNIFAHYVLSYWISFFNQQQIIIIVQVSLHGLIYVGHHFFSPRSFQKANIDCILGSLTKWYKDYILLFSRVISKILMLQWKCKCLLLQINNKWSVILDS